MSKVIFPDPLGKIDIPILVSPPVADMVGLPDVEGRRKIMDVHFKNKQLKNETLNKDDDIFIRGGLGEWPPDKVWTILDFGKHNANINGIVKMLNIAPPEPPPLSPPPPGTVQTQAEPAKKIKSMDPKVMSRVAMFENLKSETGGKKSKKKKPKKRRRSTKRRHTKRRKHTKRRRAGKMS